jgi:hypothetical protein
MSQHSSSSQELAESIQAAKQKHDAACLECARHELRVILNTLGSPVLVSTCIVLLRELQQLSAEGANPLVLLGSALATGLVGLASFFSLDAIRKYLEKSNQASAQAQRDYKEWLRLVSQTYEVKPRR